MDSEHTEISVFFCRFRADLDLALSPVFTWNLAEKLPQFWVMTFSLSSPEFWRKKIFFKGRPFFLWSTFSFRCCEQTVVPVVVFLFLLLWTNLKGGGSGTLFVGSEWFQIFKFVIRPLCSSVPNHACQHLKMPNWEISYSKLNSWEVSPKKPRSCFYCLNNYCYLLMLIHITKILTLPFQVLAILATKKQTNSIKQSFYFGYGIYHYQVTGNIVTVSYTSLTLGIKNHALMLQYIQSSRRFPKILNDKSRLKYHSTTSTLTRLAAPQKIFCPPA